MELGNKKGADDTSKSKDGEAYTVYKLMNPDSLCGYPYLATNELCQIYISISEDHFSVGTYYWEVNEWLMHDYLKTEITFEFPFFKLSEFVKQNLFESRFSVIAHTNDFNKIVSMALSLNDTELYYEVEYSIEYELLKKVANGMTSNIQLNANTHVDVLIFKGIVERLKEISELKKMLFNCNEKQKE